MYEVGDIVIYGNEGVCKVVAKGPLSISSIHQDKEYYTLEPVYQDGKVYTPIDTNIFMRAILSYEEAKEIIAEIPKITSSDFGDKNAKQLAEEYKSVMKSHDCYDLAQLIKTIYLKKQAIVESGKKVGQIDEQFMKMAEDMLYGELAIALQIPKDDVLDYIAKSMEEIPEVV